MLPFNDVVSDAVGAATKKGGITASVDGKYQVTATVAGVKGTIVFVKVFDKGLNLTLNPSTQTEIGNLTLILRWKFQRSCSSL